MENSNEEVENVVNDTEVSSSDYTFELKTVQSSAFRILIIV